MLIQVLSIVVPILVYFAAPWVVTRFDGDARQHKRLLIIACLVFFISWYLPSPLIDGEDTSFTTHFVGGGIFTGLLWIYLKRSLGWSQVWWVEAFSLFALVSALGCINELFELLTVGIGISSIPLDDTNWDILANTLGTLVVYIIYRLYDTRH